MSKQTNEQDERKSSSGEAGTAKQGAAADTKGGASGDTSSQQGGAAGKTENAPPDRSGSKRDTAAANPAGKPESKPAAAASGGKASGETAKAQAADKPTASKASGQGNKPQAAKASSAQADKPQAGKSGAQSGKSDKNEKAASSGKAEKGDKADTPASGAAAAGSGGTGGAASAPADGGGGQRKGGKSGALALVLVVVLALAVGFFAQRMWQRIDVQQQRLAELEEQAGSAASSSALDELESRVETRLDEGESERNAQLEASIASMQEEFASYRDQVNSTLDQVLEELSQEQEPDAREWLHAEAAYLLRLANQRLQLERDVEGAIALLRTADERLSEADNPALLSVRRAIASEIAILEGVPQVDRTGLYLEINAQQERLAQLPLSRELEEIPARAGLEEAPSGGWQQQLALFGEELKDLVVIRHHDQALESLISPEQESYLRQSARLVLEQAQLALLEEEQALYEASLDEALSMIDGYYDTDHEAVQAVVERLEALKARTIRPELPDISGSREALATFIERRFGSRNDQGDDA